MRTIARSIRPSSDLSSFPANSRCSMAPIAPTTPVMSSALAGVSGNPTGPEENSHTGTSASCPWNRLTNDAAGARQWPA